MPALVRLALNRYRWLFILQVWFHILPPICQVWARDIQDIFSDERQESVIPLRGRELREGRQWGVPSLTEVSLDRYTVIIVPQGNPALLSI
jgi:hypothetical protein